jgi:hypothetical protein
MAFRHGDAPTFTGTERFEVVRRVGQGGMGVVYEAIDRERGARVALKTLREMAPGSLLRLKQEFRALQDLRHPNLVSLGQLHCEGDVWFFTMELIAGVTFAEHVRAEDAGAFTLPYAPRNDTTTLATPSAATAVLEPTHEPTGAAPAPRRFAIDLARLRDALGQLAQGLLALHAANKIHRDIKPSNVLVTRDGRVVLLDFGLATDFAEDDDRADWTFAGTPAYMAPEQARGERMGPAADWYAVGVMLYEALTGSWPHHGAVAELIESKQRVAAAPARDIAPDAPEDLASLCDALLRIDPRERPRGDEILRALGCGAPPATRRTQHFVGRGEELRILSEAFAASQRNGPVTVFVHGESGVGKTALARRFTDNQREKPGVAVVWGRYYEHELVPFKAFDGLLDDVARFLARLPATERRPLLPDELPLLAQVFPVLRDLLDDEVPTRSAPADPQELRRRLYQGVREIFSRLARAHPLILVIDDVQWADRDSRHLFLEVMRPPDAPPAMILATDRMSAEGRARWIASRASIGDVRHIEVGPLSPEDARTLAHEHLGEASALAEQIAAEAHGHPFFIGELARHATEPHDAAATPPRLEQVLSDRLRALPQTARDLLELVSLCPGPLPQPVAACVTKLAPVELDSVIADLRFERLLRLGRAGSRPAIEPYHDRIRAATLAACEADSRRSAHARLAQAFEAAGHDDDEALATHWLGAGEGARALPFLTRSAARARDALAFDRAARLYRSAIELTKEAHARRTLETALGHALVHAGRGEEAAHAFLSAAATAEGSEARELRRRAADQLLRSGRVDLGLATARDVLDAVGLRLARTPRGALFGLLVRRLQVRLRGLRFRERSEGSLSAAEIERMDLCWAIASGLALVDTVRGAHFQTRHLLLALEAGDPLRVARALATESAFSAADGGRASTRTKRLCDEAHRLAARLGHPYAVGWTQATTAFVAVLEGRWSECRSQCDEAERTLREGCTGIQWELSTIHFWRTAALFYLGELRELAKRVVEREQEAESRGDLFAATCVRMNYATSVWLANDDPARAAAQAERSMREWSRRGFHVEHFWELVSRLMRWLYEGRAKDALAAIDEAWTPLRRSLLLRVQLTRLESLSLRGRCALAAAPEGGAARVELLRRAEADARNIARERMPWSSPLAELLLAGIAAVRGDDPRAISRLRAAESGFTAADMRLHAAASARCRGVLVGGDEGSTLIAQADTQMAAAGIRRPDRFARILAPGFER